MASRFVNRGDDKKMRSFSAIFKSRRIIGFFMAVVAYVFVFQILDLTGYIQPYVGSFSVDYEDNLYVGLNRKIEVYNEDGLLRTITEVTNRTFYFTIKEDHILLATTSGVYVLDLLGNVVEKSEHDPDLFRQLERESKVKEKKFNGEVYRKESPLGWTRIQNQETKTIYKISALSYIMKVLFPLCMLSFFILVLYFTKKIVRG